VDNRLTADEETGVKRGSIFYTIHLLLRPVNHSEDGWFCFAYLDPRLVNRSSKVVMSRCPKCSVEAHNQPRHSIESAVVPERQALEGWCVWLTSLI